ncbi:MAG: hypothetical protein JOZ54_14175 [Acidobacteria bacterium]|nr:hypothetical protein [Acidobacteriota bacterium]
MFIVPHLLAAETPAPPQGSAPVLKIGEKSVTIAGLTPGGMGVILMMSREPDVFITRFQQRNAAVTADKEGAAEWIADVAITPHSVWAIIDVETGRYAITCASGDCKPLEQALDSARFFRGNLASEAKGIDVPMEMAHVYFIRPKAGIWRASVSDGNDQDEDGSKDGKARISLGKFKEFTGENPPPDTFQKGDVLIVFQPLSLNFALMEVAR